MKKAYVEPEFNLIGAFTEETKSLQTGDIAAKMLGLGNHNNPSPPSGGGMGAS